MENTLIIGLGNPGKEYALTRHNFGFMILDEFAKNQKLGWTNNKKWQSQIAQFNFENKKIILAKPQTFMNASGIAVKKLVNFYKPVKVIVIYDDLNLDLGVIRLKFSGESGGHNGVKSLIKNISKDFWRLKLGIGPQPQNLSAEDFVLQKFNNIEKDLVTKIIKQGNKIILDTLKQENLEPKTITI
jgi:PTH1 family peptidyl-tRNA hydrolase